MRRAILLIRRAAGVAITTGMSWPAGANGAENGARIGRAAPEITDGPGIISVPLSMGG